jgi:glutathione peroxidase
VKISYDVEVQTIDGRTQKMSEYGGRTLLIVNVASRCGFTPQYAELEQLHGKYGARGFAVLGFPCDQFGHQEPGSEADIQRFCAERYAVTFPMFAKVDVNGPSAHPLFRVLKSARPGMFGVTRIAWNFTKFLVGPDGTVVGRYGTRVTPAAIAPDIERVISPG